MVAALGDEILGVAVADEMRADVAAAAEQAGTKAACFSILFNREISPAEQMRVGIHFIQNRAPLPRVADFKMDRYPVLRVFVLGSPRSGTSALGTALTKITQLPWHGELHAAQIFAGPAALLVRGKGTNPEVGAFLAQPQFTAAMRKQARLVYFGLHKSASFLDKTPGVPMIRSAPPSAYISAVSISR